MRRFLGLPAALLLALSVAAPAVAEDPAFVFDAGVACDFELGISGTDAEPNVYREFTDAEGNVLWSLLTGRGGSMTFVNMDTGATFTTDTTGAVARVFYHEDGSSTMYATGGWVQIQFPTDTPAGPSTTQVLGRIVTDIAADGYTTTIRSMRGRQVDICAALS